MKRTVRFVFDLIDFTDKNKVPGLLFVLNFGKAFDSLERRLVTLHFHILSLLKVLRGRLRYFTAITTHVFVMMVLQLDFPIQRGV